MACPVRVQKGSGGQAEEVATVVPKKELGGLITHGR